MKKVTSAYFVLSLGLGLLLVMAIPKSYAQISSQPLSQEANSQSSSALSERRPVTAPLDNPVFSDKDITAFTSNALNELFNQTPQTFHKRLASTINYYFTPKAGNQFLITAEKTGILNPVINNQAKASTRVGDIRMVKKELIKDGEYAGRYGWRVSVPLQMYYEAPDNKKSARRYILKLNIIRDNPNPDINYPTYNGLAISNLEINIFS